LNTSPQTAEVASISDDLPAWKREVTARLSAHRTRRSTASSQQPTLPGMESPAPAARAARVAARVAERYAKAPTYGEALAVEAAKAARAAEAAAHAAREAHQAAQAVTDVLRTSAESGHELETEEQAPGPQTGSFPVPPAPYAAQYRVNPASLPAARHSRYSESQPEPRSAVDPYPHIVDPFEEALVAPAQPLPARVLEFPRELVAARKARPRIAEGPLYENAAPEGTQLRIFEVEPEAISHQPVTALGAVEDTVLPEWSSIRLDATPRNEEISAVSGTEEVSMHTGQSVPDSRNMPSSSRAVRQTSPKKRSASHKSILAEMLPLHVAPLEDRLMAGIVDAALILCAFLLFVLVFVACTAHPPAGKTAIVAAAVALAGFAALYQWLFFTYAESTPGMRYAKIALCTFDDENPDRKSLQRRVGALFLAVLPLGLGFLWAFFDDDRLGWHDRMTRTYQRSYR
jgi:uncharacterized RDD family membrane protein YckC